MGYIFGNQCGVMTVNDERTIGQPKEIRFINSDYDLLFKIPDGGYVEIKFGDGRIKAYQCRFLDPYHFCTADGRSWHICEFAETMERIGAKYYESPEKHEVWSDMDLDLDDWRDDLQEEYPELDEDGLYEKMLELNSDYLDDERSNLKQPSAAVCLLLPTSVFGTGDIKGTGKKPMPTFRTVLTTDMTARSGMLTGTVNSAEVRRTMTEQTTMFTAKSRTARQMTILTIWKQSSMTVLPRRRTSTV